MNDHYQKQLETELRRLERRVAALNRETKVSEILPTEPINDTNNFTEEQKNILVRLRVLYNKVHASIPRGST